jgi:hypothetical protein
MKYISLLIFTVALAWTWNLVHSQSDISFETHSGIQEKLAALITETIKAKRPAASDIVIEKIWTEVLSSQQVKAFFVYSFKDNSESGPVTSQIRGEGLLERQPEDEAGNDRWVLTKVQASSDAITFDDATIITGSINGTGEAAPATENLTTPADHTSPAHPTSEPSSPEEKH